MERDENQIIAEWLAEHGMPELAWDVSEKCQQGHGSMVAVEHPEYDDYDDWVKDVGWQRHAICLECVVRSGLVRGVPDDFAYYAYDAARNIRANFQDDPSWHPEWRIQAVPFDFLQPAPLLAAVEEYCLIKARGWTLSRYRLPVTKKDRRFTAQISHPGYEDYWATGYEPMEALRAALAAAMEAEGGTEQL